MRTYPGAVALLGGIRERWLGRLNVDPEGRLVPSPCRSDTRQNRFIWRRTVLASFIKTQASSALPSPVGATMPECAARNARRVFLSSVSAAMLSATSDSVNLGRDDHIR